MTAEQWRRAREVFEEAIDLPPDTLNAWLVEHIDDAAVRMEVASLLAHHSNAGEFLTHPAGDLSALLEEASPGFPPGQRVGPYEILGEAGRGGMGRVYRARDTRLNRTVALKALPLDVAPDPSQRERLRREARAAALLSDPGICTVYALEEIDGNLYIVTEFIEGRTLRDEIAAGARPKVDQVVRTAHQLASALASAHRAGVTHRDLKPENVMRAVDGRVKILDFGLARLERSADGGSRVQPLVTQPGMVVGTPAYMAPEQLNGQPVDARTDVFAFGVLLYEYASGKHPFAAATPLALAGRVLEATPEPLERRRSDLPRTLLAVIERCLRKVPAERFGSASEVVEALGSLQPEVNTAKSGAAAVLSAPSAANARWWRLHQGAAIALYFAAAAVTWLVKGWAPGATSRVFIGVSIATAVVGVLRGHLLFTERAHGVGLDRERRRVEPVTLVLDLLIAAALAGDGLVLTMSREVAGALTIGLGVGIALARLVVEPATTRAAFETSPEPPSP